MKLEEIEKLQRDILDCSERYNQAVKKLIETDRSSKSIQELECVDEEMKSLNKKFFDWIYKKNYRS